MKALVIVESPTKTKTIRKYLPDGYVVDASMGHIRDLPSKATEIPAALKKESWASLGIDVEHGFTPLYVVPTDKKKVVSRLKDLLKDADELILATDEDREGEAISWHLVEVLKPKIPVRRMVFREITEEAIRKAVGETRDIDLHLVQAQETRRLLDRLAGYTISPLLWKKIAPGLSAGRVQSVAVRLLVDRELERMRFRSGSYFDIRAVLSKQAMTGGPSAGSITADLTHVGNRRIATGKDFDEQTGRLKKPDDVLLLDEKAAGDLQARLETAQWSVRSIDVSQKLRTPAPPFITSTLQQEANRKFGFSARDTMSIAQKLYENGLITYMRTDSPSLSDQAVQAARSEIEQQYGASFLSGKVRTYKSGDKAAQEAHEAIRPAGSRFQHPDRVGLSGREHRLYDLIWKRTIATQMAEARLEFTNVEIEAVADDQSALFKASGKRILFPGYFRAYVEGSDDPDAAIENQENPLPDLSKDEALDLNGLEALGHETKPPARYTEATLVKALESEGIGRPSTYASIIGTIVDRGYVRPDGKALVPTFTAFAVTELLVQHFPHLVDTSFTSQLENKLDDIARGSVDPTTYLRDYYLGATGLRELVESQESRIDVREARRIDLPLEGLEESEILIGRFGPYVKARLDGEEVSASIPEMMNPADLTPKLLQDLLRSGKEGPQSLGVDPASGKDVFVLSGRFGPYVQLGQPEEGSKEKPKRASLPKGLTPDAVDLEKALSLLSLPRLVGVHPDTGKEIRAGIGRFGPFVVHDGTFKSLKKGDDVLSVGLDRALELLAEAGPGRASTVLHDLGPHPKTGQALQILQGRYGPYIKVGKDNFSLPKGVAPEGFTLEQAVQLIEEGAKTKSAKKGRGGRKTR